MDQKRFRNLKGMSIIEALLAVSIFALLVMAFVGAWLYGQEATIIAGKNNQAVFLAEEGLEAARNIRDASFAGLPADGQYGLSSSGGQWSFLGIGTTDTTGGYSRHVDIATIDATTKKITATVTWNQNFQRSGSYSAETRLTQWRDPRGFKGGMLVYGNGGTTSDSIQYKTLDPTTDTWDAAGSTADVDGVTTNKALRAVRVYASATRNEKIMISRHYDGSGQFIYAQVWNGSSWGNVVQLATWNAATFLDAQNFDGAYLANGNFVAVYSDNSNTPKSRVWNGTGWLGQASLTTLGGAHIPSFIVAKARPNTNEVMGAFFTQGLGTLTEYYSGSAWSAVASHATAAPANSRRLIDFDWSPNNPLVGGLVYANSANSRAITIKIWTANGSGGGSWSAAATTGNQGTGSTRLQTLSVSGRPGANEFIACDSDTQTRILCFESSFAPAWTNPTNQTLTAATDTGIQRTYHVGYEQSSGNPAIAVYSDNTAIPKLKKFDPTIGANGTWDAAATSLSPVTSSPLKTVEIVPQTGTDEMMILLGDNAQDLFSVIWDGTGNAIYSAPAGFAFTSHGTNGSAATDYWFDFAWNQY